MKAIKITLICMGIVVGCIAGSLVLYKALYSQEIAKPFEVNSSDLEQNVLIATQGSDFKNALVSGITKELEEQPIYINVVDVSALPKIKEDEWNALVLINTCESSKLQKHVKDYIARAKKLEKVVLLITSGSGNWKPDNLSIDSITSASKMENVNSFVSEILGHLNALM